jgi:hypothetical protein
VAMDKRILHQAVVDLSYPAGSIRKLIGMKSQEYLMVVFFDEE